MKLFQKLMFENCYNSERVYTINEVAGRAIQQMGLQCDYAIKNTYLSDDGFLHIEFVEGQELNTREIIAEMQSVFDEIFQDMIFEEPGF